tara:strand:+ start:2448 stop:3521 length:1074 start_codon:yes stop_codon:yes gene_type:complete
METITPPSTPKKKPQFRTFVQVVQVAKYVAQNARKKVAQNAQKKVHMNILKKVREERHKIYQEKKATSIQNKATSIQRIVRGMLVRMKEQKKKQKKKKISTKTVDQLMLRQSRARSLLGAEQEDTLIGKISTKKISTKTVDQLMLKRRPGASSLLGTVPEKSKHSRIEEVDRLMRLRPETPALVALGTSDGIRRNIAKIDSMVAKIKKTLDKNEPARFRVGQHVVCWEKHRWVPCTIQLGGRNGQWVVQDIHGQRKTIKNVNVMPTSYVEESLASILKTKVDEITATMKIIGADQIKSIHEAMLIISAGLTKNITIRNNEHNEIIRQLQNLDRQLAHRLALIQNAATNQWRQTNQWQ